MNTNKIPNNGFQLFRLSQNKEIDSEKISTFELLTDKRLEELSFSDRFSLLSSWERDLYYQKSHFHYRVLLDGCKTVCMVRDPYTGEPREMIHFGSNDYLNLTQHPRVKKAAMDAIELYGSGAGSSAITTGTIEVREQLERKLAEIKGTESASVFISGYNTNVGVLSGILRHKDVAIVDMLCHASIHDGVAGRNHIYFKHNDMASLELALKKAKSFINRIIVVDGVYSMDGDIAPLPDIVDLARKYDALIMVDDAHALGVLGKNGYGTSDHFGLKDEVDIHIGTLSKSAGSQGGYVAGKESMIKYLQFAARSQFFTTAPFIAANAASLEAISVIQEHPELRENLWRNTNYFKSKLIEAGVNILQTETPIFPIITGNVDRLKRLTYVLHEAGILAIPVPYPAVPRRKSRVRLTITAGHTKDQIDFTFQVVKKELEKMNLLMAV